MTTAGTPLVSVILPAYNAQATLAQAVHSVLSQDYVNLELLVVDDGSTDNTVQHPVLRDPRIRVLQQKNSGPAAARNLGIAQARGALIAFIDADDVWMPGKLSTQVNYLQSHPSTFIVFGGFQRWLAEPDGGITVPKSNSFPSAPRSLKPHSSVDPSPTLLAQPSGWIYTDLLLDSVVHIITAVVRKPVFDTVGMFDESLATGEDYDFWLRASRQFKIDQLAKCVAYYRIHQGSITKMPRAENNEYRVVNKALCTWGATGPDGQTVDAAVLRNRLFGICFGHGYLHFWHGSPIYALKAFSLALRHSCMHPKAWLYWLLCLPLWVKGFVVGKLIGITLTKTQRMS